MTTSATPAPGALAGLKVIDVSRILGGPYCGQILGDHGADVIKVEPPQGDDTRTGNAHPNICPYDSFHTASVQLFLAVGNDRQFQLLCQHLKAPELATDPRYASNSQRCIHREPLSAALETLFASHDGEALAQALMDIGVPCAPVLNVQQALEHPHTAHRQMVVSIGDDYRGLGSPIKLSRTPASYRLPPPV